MDKNVDILLAQCDYLAEAVDDDECGSQEVTVRGVFSHDVLVPQLDRHQGPKQLAQVLNQQVELTLDKYTKLETTINASKYFNQTLCPRTDGSSVHVPT